MTTSDEEDNDSETEDVDDKSPAKKPLASRPQQDVIKTLIQRDDDLVQRDL